VVFSTDSRTVQHQDSEDGSGGNCKFQIYTPLLILSVGLSNDGKLQGQNRCIAFLLKPIGKKDSHFHTIPLHIHKDCQEPQKAVSRALSICIQLLEPCLPPLVC